MDKQQLKTGIAIVNLIEVTEKALTDLNDWIESGSRSVGGDSYDKDNHYNLCISAFKDGSGYQLNLSRYMGNTALLEVIKTELERQLKVFKEDLAKL